MDDSQRCLAWELELDRLELELQRFARLLETMEPVDHEEWSVPTVVGTMPGHLLSRAQEIQERQVAMMAALAGALQRRARERSFVTQLDHAIGEVHAPAYIDLSA